MAIKAEVRYLKDKNGETFIPMTHIDYVIGVPDTLPQRINDLENDNYYLKNIVYELSEKVERLEKGNDNVLP